MKLTEEGLRLALKNVMDPELNINIVDLGLVYAIKIDGGDVVVEMTLTSPGCPLAPIIDQLVKSELGVIEGVKSVSLVLVWDPPWVMDMISEEGKAELGVD